MFRGSRIGALLPLVLRRGVHHSSSAAGLGVGGHGFGVERLYFEEVDRYTALVLVSSASQGAWRN